MCRDISVAETFISYLKFHTKLRLEYLLCLKKNTFVSRKPIFLIPAWDQKSFFCHPNSIFYHHGRLHHLWPPACFCQTNLEKFCRIFQELRFGSHMRSSWDLPFNNKYYYMATIVRAVQLAAEQARFPFHDRALLALCPRHIQSVFDLIVDFHIMVNWQLSKMDSNN